MVPTSPASSCTWKTHPLGFWGPRVAEGRSIQGSKCLDLNMMPGRGRFWPSTPGSLTHFSGLEAHSPQTAHPPAARCFDVLSMVKCSRPLHSPLWEAPSSSATSRLIPAPLKFLLTNLLAVLTSATSQAEQHSPCPTVTSESMCYQCTVRSGAGDLQWALFFRLNWNFVPSRFDPGFLCHVALWHILECIGFYSYYWRLGGPWLPARFKITDPRVTLPRSGLQHLVPCLLFVCFSIHIGKIGIPKKH